MNDLPAGRKLDALIDWKVMGRATAMPPSDWIGWDHAELLPFYSTDITAAWLVVEKLRKSRWGIRMEANDVDGSFCGGPAITVHFWKDKWYNPKTDGMDLAQLTRGNSDYRSRYEPGDVPLAICRAALGTVE